MHRRVTLRYIIHIQGDAFQEASQRTLDSGSFSQKILNVFIVGIVLRSSIEHSSVGITQ